MVTTDLLNRQILLWFDENNINPYSFLLKSTVLGTNIDFGYIGDKLSDEHIISFEDNFNVSKDFEKINVLDYKTYDKKNNVYVDLTDCRYVFSGDYA